MCAQPGHRTKSSDDEATTAPKSAKQGIPATAVPQPTVLAATGRSLFERHGEKYAIIINGDANEERHRGNVDSAVKALIARGVPPANIYVVGQGQEGAGGTNRLPGTAAGVEQAFAQVSTKAGKDALVSVYVTGHGDLQNGQHTINLGNEKMSHERFRELASSVKGQGFYVLDLCYGATLANALVDNGVASLAMAPEFEVRESYCQFFTRQFWDAIRLGQDINRDGETDMREVFSYAMEIYRAKTGTDTTGAFRQQLPKANADLLKMKGPALLEISTIACEPCKRQAGILNSVGATFGSRLPIFTADAEEGAKLLQRLGIKTDSYPTLVYLMDGKPVLVQNKLRTYGEILTDLSGQLNLSLSQQTREGILELARRNVLSGRPELITFGLNTLADLGQRLTEDEVGRVLRAFPRAFSLARMDFDRLKVLIPPQLQTRNRLRQLLDDEGGFILASRFICQQFLDLRDPNNRTPLIELMLYRFMDFSYEAREATAVLVSNMLAFASFGILPMPKDFAVSEPENFRRLITDLAQVMIYSSDPKTGEYVASALHSIKDNYGVQIPVAPVMLERLIADLYSDDNEGMRRSAYILSFGLFPMGRPDPRILPRLVDLALRPDVSLGSSDYGLFRLSDAVTSALSKYYSADESSHRKGGPNAAAIRTLILNRANPSQIPPAKKKLLKERFGVDL